MITFRELTADDADAFAALRKLVVADSPVQMGLSLDEELQRPLEEFREQLAASGPSTVFGAFDTGTLVATAGICRPTTRPSGAHKAVLWGVFTAPTHRRRALARKLSEQAIERAFSTWAQRVYLYVFLPNQPAVRLYESLGFTATGCEPEVLRLGSAFHDIQSMSRRRGAWRLTPTLGRVAMSDPILHDVPESIESDRLTLRCPRPGDGKILYESVAESLQELRKHIASVPWVAAEQSVESSEIYCRNAFANFAARRDMPYLVFERSTQVLVGCVGLHRPNWQTPKFEVGYWCRSSQSGNGYVTEAVRAVVKVAAHTLRAVRVELFTDAENVKSKAVAERAGFVLEGVLMNERRAPDGSLRNTCVYARTANAA